MSVAFVIESHEIPAPGDAVRDPGLIAEPASA
jgi:hypothetical protein